jgi:prepilin-type N-terminal cleavage/methylation domain-containing protein
MKNTAAKWNQKGMTLLELIIASAILLILAKAALPVVRFTVVRPKEPELRRDLREIRDAIDRYKDYADRNRIRVEVGSEGYLPDLQTLVKGSVDRYEFYAEGAIPAANPCGPDHGTCGLEFTSYPKRSGFDILGRQACFRRPFEIPGDSPRRHALL